MNVLPVLTDQVSTTAQAGQPSEAPNSSPGRFAQLLDSSMSGGSTSKASTPRPGDSSPHRTNDKTASDASKRAAAQERSSTDKTNKKPQQTDPSSHHPQKASSKERPKGSKQGQQSGPASDHHPKATDGANASKTAKATDGATKGGKKAHGKKTAAPSHGHEHARQSTESGFPFPGAIIVSGSGKTGSAAASKGSGKEPTGKPVKASLAAAPDAAASLKQAGDTKTGQTKPGDKKALAAAHTVAEKGKKLSAGGAHQSSESVQLAAQGQVNPAAQQGPNHQNQQLPAVAVHPAPQHPSAHPAPSAVQSTVTIVDLRQPGQNGNAKSDSKGSQGSGQNGGNVRLFQVADGGNGPASSLNGQTGTLRAAPPPPPNGQGFAAMTDQIVKQTGILLKDHNSGEIRLVLKPEHLGSLRIKIDMNNNNLTGRILVQNHDALRLVQQNLDGLYRALRESGFTASGLDVSVGGGYDKGERDKERSSPLPSMRAVAGAQGFDRQTPGAESGGSNYSLVNLVI